MDLTLKMTANGGDLVLKGNNLEATDSIFNQPLLAWFGGNVEASTTGNELPEEQRFDWWGNSLLFAQNESRQFNSSLERALNSEALNSASRLSLARIAKDDLSFLRNFANIEADVIITSVNRVQIQAQLNEPNNIQDKILRVLWDATKQEVITEETI